MTGVASRNILNVDLGANLPAVEEFCGRTGMSRRELVARIFHLFAQLDEEGRAALAQTLPKKHLKDAARQIAEKVVELGEK